MYLGQYEAVKYYDIESADWAKLSRPEKDALLAKYADVVIWNAPEKGKKFYYKATRTENIVSARSPWSGVISVAGNLITSAITPSGTPVAAPAAPAVPAVEPKKEGLKIDTTTILVGGIILVGIIMLTRPARRTA